MQVDFETRGNDGSPAMAFVDEAQSIPPKVLTMNTFSGDEAEAVAEFQPKKQPSVHRHLHVDGAITKEVVDHVLKSLPEGLPAQVGCQQLAERLGYEFEDLNVRVRRRIERWKAGPGAKGHRMPTHIKVAATSLAIIDEVGKALEAYKPPTAGQMVKKWAGKLKAELKEAMA